MSENVKGAWIFVSHSSRDWNKVRAIRNFLEEKGHNPLLFHLKCLSDDDEVNELLKREINARNWFVLCDSINARNSPYVTNEINYIKELDDKVFEVIDLEKGIDAQLYKIIRLYKRATVYLSYSREDREIAQEIALILRENDFEILLDNELLSPGDDFEKKLKSAIDSAINNGYFIQLISKNSLQSKWCLKEIEYAFEQSDKLPFDGNIIPISIVEPYILFETLRPLLNNRIANLNIADFSKGELRLNMERVVKDLKTRKMM